MPSSFSFDLTPNRSERRKEPQEPWRILLLADLSGREHRGQDTDQPLPERPIRRIDFDRFESVFEKVAPHLSLPHGDGSLEVGFQSLDDFHPDAVFDRLGTFAAFRSLRERLEDPHRFAEAVEEMKSGDLGPEHLGVDREASTTTTSEQATPGTDTDKAGASDFAQLLGGTVEADPAARPSAGRKGAIDAYLHGLVAPHITPEMIDQPAYLSILDSALEEGMRGLLHHPAWQALEATWRSLAAWTQDANLDEQVELSVLDMTTTELAADLSPADLTQSALHHHLSQAEAGGNGFDLILVNSPFGQSATELTGLAALGAMGARVGAPILAAASPALCGRSRFSDPSEVPCAPLDQELAEIWTAIRQSPVAPWIGLVAPRLLLRLPYGSHSDPVDRFVFEEHMGPPLQRSYLWGLGVLELARTLLSDALGTAVGNLLEGVPAPTYRDEDGETQMVPPAEVYLSERVRDEWIQAGLSHLISVKGRDHVLIPRIQSIASPPTRLQGRFR